MKKNDRADLRSKTTENLKKQLFETRQALAKTKLELAQRKHTNVHLAKKIRKKAAVIQTLIREKELQG